MRYSEKDNFNRVLRCDNPSHVSFPPPSRGGSYFGAWPSDVRPSEDAREWRDIWGARWEDADGEVFPFGGAVDSYEKIDEIVPPDPFTDDRMRNIRKVIEETDRDEFFIAVGHPYFLYEKSINVLPPDQFLMCMAADQEKTEQLLDMFMDFELGIAKQYCEFRPDHINLSDDVGIQDRMAMSPDMWRMYFKPRVKRIVDFYRSELGDDITVSMHSCGHVMPILLDYSEIGIDVLNPIQTTANDLPEMRKITKGKLTLAGGIDGQKILPFGTPEEVREEVFRKCDMLWDGGGYLPMAEKMLGVSAENKEAMVKAIADWSKENVES